MSVDRTPHVDAIRWDAPSAHPHDILTAPGLAAAAGEGYDLSRYYREIARAAIDRLHAQQVEIERFREQHARLIAEFRELRERRRRAA